MGTRRDRVLDNSGGSGRFVQGLGSSVLSLCAHTSPIRGDLACSRAFACFPNLSFWMSVSLRRASVRAGFVNR